MFKKRLSIMVPAFNEEANLENTVKEIKKSIDKRLETYEILIFDDGSRDKTGYIADKLVRTYQNIKTFHNKKNSGTGYCYSKGLELAKYEHYMYIPGDNQFPSQALSLMLQKLGSADIIIPYVKNMHIRPFTRRVISVIYTFLINSLFGLNIIYYNAPVIHKTALLRGVIPRKNSGHAYQTYILVHLIKAGASYTEVGFNMYERKSGGTSAFKIKNIIRVVNTLFSMFWDIKIRRKLQITKAVRIMLS